MTPDEHARQAEQLTRAADRLHDTLGDPQLNAVARRDTVAEIHALAALAQVHAALSVRSPQASDQAGEPAGAAGLSS